MGEDKKKSGQSESAPPSPIPAEVSEDFAVVPRPSDGEAVKEALDVAQSFGALRGQRPIGGAFNVSGFDDSVSLFEYIEDAEKRSRSLFESSSSKQGPLEDLDVLNIAAEFGRPDDSNETSDDVHPDVERDSNPELFDNEKTGEDTRDLTLKSRVPAPYVSTTEGGPNGTIRPLSSPSTFDAVAATEPLGPEHLSDEILLSNGGADFGELKDTGTIDLLTRLYLEKKSGMLIVKDSRNTSRLFVQGGDIVMAETSETGMAFAGWLRRDGYLDKDAYADLLRDTSSLNNLQSGSALVSRGIIGPRDLNRLLRKYYEFVVLHLFSWNHGTWRFEQSNKVSPGDTSVLIESPTPGMLFQGFTKYASLETIEAVAPRDSFLARTANGICRLPELGLDDVGQSLLESCDGTNVIWNRLDQNPFEAERYHRIVAALVRFGFVRLVDEEDVAIESWDENDSSDRGNHHRYESFLDLEDGPQPENIKHAMENVPVESANAVDKNRFDDVHPSGQGGLPAQLAKIDDVRKRVLMKLETVRDGSYYDILEVDVSASPNELADAWQRCQEEVNWERLSLLGLVDLEDDVRLIREIVDEAYEVLTHPSISGMYRMAQDRDDSSRQS